MTTALGKIAEKAGREPQLRFTALAHVLTPEFLRESWRALNRRGAAGVDGETARDFEERLDDRLRDLHERLKTRNYRAPPVRRVEIPKGNGKMRPLGMHHIFLCHGLRQMEPVRLATWISSFR